MIKEITHPQFGNNKIKHGFLTKNIEGSTHQYVEKDYAKKAEVNADIMNNHKLALETFKVKAEKINVLNQTHTNKVIILEQNFPFMQEPEADAMVTKTPGIVLGAITADCVPILFADTENNIIGAAHAGWKGARADIVSNVIKEMNKLGANKISAVIGPCIHQQSYEIGPEFYDNFLEEDKDNSRFFIPSPKNSHHLFDLPGYVTHKLKLQKLENIYNINKDTLTDKDNFFSFRRFTLDNSSAYGSLIAMITITND